jgi:hypothetical protein
MRSFGEQGRCCLSPLSRYEHIPHLALKPHKIGVLRNVWSPAVGKTIEAQWKNATNLIRAWNSAFCLSGGTSQKVSMRPLHKLQSSWLFVAVATMTIACNVPPGAPADSDDDVGSGNRGGDGDAVGDGDGDVVGDGDGDVVGDGDGDVVGDGDGDVVGDGDGDVVGDGDGITTTQLLPARIRRLTNAEYTQAVQSLLGTDADPGAVFPPDSRQRGYTVNEAQRVDPLLAKQLDSVATELAAEAIAELDNLAPCADPDGGGDACASSFASSFASKAYRRPLESGELESLMTLYRAGESGGSYAEGIELLIRGVLQTPAFLYLTEIGDGTQTGTVVMTAHELASALSFLLTSGPPDSELLAAAEAGELTTPEGRVAQARRLLSGSDSGERLVRIVREWLGIDRIYSTAKDSNIHPRFEGFRSAMGAETEAFVMEAISTDGGNVATLLGADWTVASSELTAMYQEEGPVRRGLLNQGAFLSVYSHAQETGPVLRGTTVMRRVACLDIDLPTNLTVEIIPPVPDLEKTTRERFDIHSADPGCQGCHSLIDPVGFSFEHMDAMGAYRATENEIDVDSATTVVLGADFDGSYTDSNELAVALSESAEVRACFARQLFRATVGEGVGAETSEDAFVDAWESLPAADQGSLIEILVAMAKSNLFSHRGEQ